MRNNLRILSSSYLWILLTVSVFADNPEFSIRLVDGSVGYGELVASQVDHQLSFHVQGFAQAFQFKPDKVYSVRRLYKPEDPPTDDKSVLGKWLFALDGRTQISGKLLAMDEQNFVIENELLGILKLPRADVQWLSKQSNTGQRIKAAFDAADWAEPNKLGHWDLTALKLSTRQPGSRIGSQYELPKQAEIKISLQWTSKPQFSIGFGVNSKQKLDENQQQWAIPEGQKPVPFTGRLKSFASLEVWGGSLVLVRESAKQSDFINVRELEKGDSGNRPANVELTIYLDFDTGIAAAQTWDGKIHQIQLDPQGLAQGLKGVSIQNFGPALTVDRLEVNTWDGQLPVEFSSGQSVVIKQDGTSVDGEIQGWDATSSSWIVGSAQGQEKLAQDDLKLASFARVSNNAEPANSEKATELEPKKIELDSESAVAENIPTEGQPPIRTNLILRDGSKISGELSASADGTIGFQAAIMSESRPIGVDQISEITADAIQPGNAAEIGKIAIIGLSQIRGAFLENTPPGSATALFWQPEAGINASELGYSLPGEIRDLRATKVAKSRRTVEIDQPAQAAAVAQQGPGILMQIFGGALAKPMRKSADPKTEPRNEPVEAVSRLSQIRFRSGDAAPATVLKITDAGVQFESQRTSTTFAPNKSVDQIFFRSAKNSKLSDVERERLLTIPRAQKNDPPTHLVISIAGDYLRGHLIEVTPQKTTLEVRGELMEFPTEELSEIVWLYDRNWTNPGQKPEPAASDVTDGSIEESAQAVHVVVGEDGLTLLPQTVQNGTLVGKTEFLGESSVRLQDLSLMFFGPGTNVKARQRHNETYELSLAKSPKEQVDGQDGEGGQATSHVLVGKTAPPISLKNLAGESFRLEDQRGQIVVLDFWASWCGPCMQAMPQVDELIAEFSDSKVRLLAVNIQEAKPRIELALQRLNLGCEVLLDVDGEIASAYKAEAIPQTVIIDKTGVVADVIVGGGANSIDRIRQVIVGLLAKENDPTTAN